MHTKTKNWQSELVDCIHFLHTKGFAPATSSNYSIRPDESSDFYISSSGIDKGTFSEADLMHVNSAGVPIGDHRKPSAETLLHVLVYQHMPEIKCVLHTHTVYNTVLSTLFQETGQLRLEGFEVLKGLAGIKTHDTYIDVPIFQNSQDMQQLSAEIQAHWQKHGFGQGFLLAGHGLYTWGKDIAEAKRQVEVFEFLFEVFYKIKSFSVVSLPN